MGNLGSRSSRNVRHVFATCLLFVALPSLLFAEDPKLREKAVELLERANQVSTPPTHPPNEHDIAIRVFATNQNEAGEGQVKMTWASGRQRRIETTYGSFHLLNIWYDDKLIVSGDAGAVTPPIVRTTMRHTPIHLVRFDHEDTIRSIDDAVIRGRAAQCVEFDTAFGATVHNNEICIDKELGTIVRFRDGADMEENSEFSSFAGALFPGRIDLFHNGAQTVELHQTFAAIEGPVPLSLFATPPGAEVRVLCQNWRQAFGQSMPQPPAGSGSESTDIVIQGVIGPDGKVYSTAIVSSDRPDLNTEALKLISTWTYTPALCNGEPNWQKEEITLHFQGR